MSYLDTLIEAKNSIEKSNDVAVNYKLVVIKLIEERLALTEAFDNPFHYWYADIISNDDIFSFENVLNDSFKGAEDNAKNCIRTCLRFNELPVTNELDNWLSSAIKVVNAISLHYLQDILKEAPEKQGDAGKERSVYIQINKKGNSAQKAGQVMDNIFDKRNDMEHRMVNDKDNPGRKRLSTPKFNKVKRYLIKNFPAALVSFNNAYKGHYQS